MDPPLTPCPESHGRKRVHFITNPPDQSDNKQYHREASPPAGNIHHPNTEVSAAHQLTPAPMPGEPHIAPEIISQSTPQCPNDAPEAPNTAPRQPLASEGAPNYNINAVTSTHDAEEVPGQIPISSEGVSTYRPQYKIFHGSTALQHSKR